MEQVRLGVIGCGWAGAWHCENFLRDVPEAGIVAVADPVEEKREALRADLFGGRPEKPAAFRDHREMLAERELDGVVVSTPHALHFEQTIDALSVGCQVLVDKPMVTSTEEARALIEHARACGREISIALQGPYSAEWRYVRGLVERGDLGEVYLVVGACVQPWLDRLRGTWRTRPELSGGGNLYDSGAHMFTGMLYLSGLAALEAFAFVDWKAEEVDVTGAVALRLERGALGSAAVSGAATAMEEGVYIHGTRGSVKTSIYGGPLEHWDGARRVESPSLPVAASLERNFADCILGRAATLTPPSLGLRLTRLLDAVYESARTDVPVAVVADDESREGECER